MTTAPLTLLHPPTPATDGTDQSAPTRIDQLVTELRPVVFRLLAAGNIRAAWEVRRRGGYRTGLYASSIRYDGEQQQQMEMASQGVTAASKLKPEQINAVASAMGGKAA